MRRDYKLNFTVKLQGVKRNLHFQVTFTSREMYRNINPASASKLSLITFSKHRNIHVSTEIVVPMV